MPRKIDKKHHKISLSHGIKIKSNVKLISMSKFRLVLRILRTENE